MGNPHPSAEVLRVSVQPLLGLLGWVVAIRIGISTRPTGLAPIDAARQEGSQTIYPVVQGPQYRAANRMVMINSRGKQVEAFRPPMKRVADAKAGWSEW